MGKYYKLSLESWNRNCLEIDMADILSELIHYLRSLALKNKIHNYTIPMPINDEAWHHARWRPPELMIQAAPQWTHSEPPIYNQVINLQLMPGDTTSQISTPYSYNKWNAKYSTTHCWPLFSSNFYYLVASNTRAKLLQYQWWNNLLS